MKSLVTCLIVCSSFLALSQDPNSEVQDAINRFMDADNPMNALSILRDVEAQVSSADDSTAANYYVCVGICFGQMGNADSSFYFLDQAEEIGKQAQLDLILVKVSNTRGLVYMGLANYEASLAAYYQAIELAEGKEDPKIQESIRKVYGNAGGIHYQLGDFEKAIDLTQKALLLSQSFEDSSGMAYNHLRLALVYNDANSLEKGIDNLNQSVNYFKNLGDTITLIYAENTLGRVFEKQSNYKEAFQHYEAANQLAQSLVVQEEVAFTLMSMASVKLKLNQPAQARSYAKQAKEFSKTHGYANSLMRAYDLLYQSEELQNNYKAALNYLNLHTALSDSLNGVEVKERVAELETKYETTKKEAEIERLSLENDLQSANLAQARNRQFAIGIGAGMTILLLVIYFVQRNKKLNAEREAQELQVEALKKRFMELHSSPSELAVEMNMKDLNEKLHTPLTEREFDTLKHSIEGKSNSEISDQLFISVSTVKFHLRNSYSKMGVGNRKEAFQFMLKSS